MSFVGEVEWDSGACQELGASAHTWSQLLILYYFLEYMLSHLFPMPWYLALPNSLLTLAILWLLPSTQGKGSRRSPILCYYLPFLGGVQVHTCGRLDIIASWHLGAEQGSGHPHPKLAAPWHTQWATQATQGTKYIPVWRLQPLGRSPLAMGWESGACEERRLISLSQARSPYFPGPGKRF